MNRGTGTYRELSGRPTEKPERSDRYPDGTREQGQNPELRIVSDRLRGTGEG
jgi:hypothetical protein